ncbi:MAG: hypothetical protein J5992_06790 [Oscillospiraceae bacterium]|nr:hypothetical protein [Oscillospiraceae bacterium]
MKISKKLWEKAHELAIAEFLEKECGDWEELDKYEREDYVWAALEKLLQESTKEVVNAVMLALFKYDSDNIDIIRNEENNMLDIMYCDRHNSFPILSNVIDADYVNCDRLMKELERLDVGITEF